MLLDKGRGKEFKGKTLNDIQLSNEEVEEDERGLENESDVDNPSESGDESDEEKSTQENEENLGHSQQTSTNFEFEEIQKVNIRRKNLRSSRNKSTNSDVNYSTEDDSTSSDEEDVPLMQRDKKSSKTLLIIN